MPDSIELRFRTPKERAFNAPFTFLVRSLVTKIRLDPTAGDPAMQAFKTQRKITLYDPLRDVPHTIIHEEIVSRLTDETTPKELDLLETTVDGLPKKGPLAPPLMWSF